MSHFSLHYKLIFVFSITLIKIMLRFPFDFSTYLPHTYFSSLQFPLVSFLLFFLMCPLFFFWYVGRLLIFLSSLFFLNVFFICNLKAYDHPLLIFLLFFLMWPHTLFLVRWSPTYFSFFFLFFFFVISKPMVIPYLFFSYFFFSFSMQLIQHHKSLFYFIFKELNLTSSWLI